MDGCFLENFVPTTISGTSHMDDAYYSPEPSQGTDITTSDLTTSSYSTWRSENTISEEASGQGSLSSLVPGGLLRAFSMDSASSGVDVSDFRGGINRSTSFNSRTKMEDLDRSLSISLEELMENIRVPQTGRETPIDDVDESCLDQTLLAAVPEGENVSSDTTLKNNHDSNLPSFSESALFPTNHELEAATNSPPNTDSVETDQQSYVVNDNQQECNTVQLCTGTSESNPSPSTVDGESSQVPLPESTSAFHDETTAQSGSGTIQLYIDEGENRDCQSNIVPVASDQSCNVAANITDFNGQEIAPPIGGDISHCDQPIVDADEGLKITSDNIHKKPVRDDNTEVDDGTPDRASLSLNLCEEHDGANTGDEEAHTASKNCRTPEYCRELSALALNQEAEGTTQCDIDPNVPDHIASPVSPDMVKLSRPRCAKEIQEDVLYSGVVSFPGCSDLSRRPILFLFGNTDRQQSLGKMEVARFMLYLVSSVPCVTLVVSLRGEDSWKLIKDSILLFQWNRPGIVSRILFVLAESYFHAEENMFSTQCNYLPNVAALQEFIDVENLPEVLGGSYGYSHIAWVRQRLDLESYVLLCEMLHHNFARNTVAMSTAAMPTTLEETTDMLNRHRSTMTELLDDPRVRDLHDTGHRFLTVLKTDLKFENQSYADRIHSSYESVCSAIQRYVQVADERLLALERHLLVKQFEESCDRILSWASDRQDELHQKFGEVADSLNDLRKQRQEFDRFYLEVVKQYAQCDCLLSEANQLSSSGFLGKVNSQARNAAEKISQVVQDMEMKKEEVETASQLYLFVDQAYSWALTGMKFVASLSMSEAMTIEEYQGQIEKYDEYMSSHPPIANEEFAQMQEIALRFNNVKCQRQCEVAQQKCNETKDLFRKRRRLLVKARDRQHAEMKKKESQSESSPPSEAGSNESRLSEQMCSSPPPSETESSESPTKSRTILRQNSDISHRMNRPLVCSNNNNNGGLPNDEGPNESAAAPVPSKHRPKKMLRKSASMSSHHSHKLKIGSPMRSQEPDTHGRTKWSLAIEELITTEEEYVRSLEYIIEHYYPLMNQLDDVPQALRGKRGVVFGNVENIRDFHARQFLSALQGCEDDPGRVAEVFIQHRESFGMYALYSKNKPRSDELMREHGNKFFKAKQHALRDKMDLASYLLKPVQRMGKYALLLHNIAKHSDVRYKSSLREAESLVKFQLRHGNDLLAMDSIIDCDVNLKEQGELRRQDEFIIFHGRRKFVRQVFLFDDLILLGKPQRVHGGHDLYHYKSSYKTSELGLTENIGDTGLKFEIWFRRPMQDNVIFHSSSEQKKQAWVDEIRNILWKQALRNKANRQNEMVNMGIGSKPHLDIRLSQSPITDRSVAADKLMGGRVLSSRSRASIAVASFEHACKRPHSTVSTSSTSSNGSFQFATHQPASMFDFRAIMEGDEYESGSGHGSSLCASNGEADTIEGNEVPPDARPQQYVTTV